VAVFDATMLVLLFSPNPGTPTDAAGNLIERPAERAKALVAALEKDKTKVIVPTPALAEALVRAGVAASQAYITKMKRSAAFRIVDFDEKAAVEVAAWTAEAISRGDKRDGLSAPWTKVKYDRQIIAIAITEGDRIIYSDDKDIQTLGRLRGLTVRSLGDVPVPVKEISLFDDIEEDDEG
jgi:predicted nucleic acid-binding protein